MISRRRALLVAFGLVATPFAHTQTASGPRRISYLHSFDRNFATHYVALLSEALRRLGHRVGDDVTIDVRGGPGDPERIAAIAADIVRERPDIILTTLDYEALAVKRATSRIPVIVTASIDPVGNGLVASLARPGGNVTGLTYEAGFDVASKRIEILHDAVPALKSVGFLFNPDYPGMSGYEKVWRATCGTLGLSGHYFEARSARELARVLPIILASKVGALFVADGWTDATADDRRQLIKFANESDLPAMYVLSLMVEMGGLIAYLPSIKGRAERAAAFIDRILKGARPATLPVEQPTHYELIVNLKTAKSIGISIPRALLARADRVIE